MRVTAPSSISSNNKHISWSNDVIAALASTGVWGLNMYPVMNINLKVSYSVFHARKRKQKNKQNLHQHISILFFVRLIKCRNKPMNTKLDCPKCKYAHS